jgi:hypothetical protein
MGLRNPSMNPAGPSASILARTTVLADKVAVGSRPFSQRHEKTNNSASNDDRKDTWETSVMLNWLSPGRFSLALTALVFVAFPMVALGLRTFSFRDYGLFSYPVAFFARESFWRGELPLWNPLNYCGVPFLAQWNTMVFYPPTVLYLLLPLGWGLSLFCLLHLVCGGLGMFCLVRAWTGMRLTGALAGILFAFSGLNMNFLMWPSHVATFSWFPWVLWLVSEGWRSGGRNLVWGVGVATLQMLAGGPETILLTWLLLACLAISDACNGAEVSAARWQIAIRFFGMVGLVALLCAVQLLPFLELLKHSQRDTTYSASAHDWAMPIWGWANFLVPLFRTNPTPQGVFLQNGQYWTSSYYVGIGTIWLGAIGVWRLRDRRVRLLAAGCFLALVLAWGDTSLLFQMLRSSFPGLGFMRYPIKFVILPVAVLPIIAAYGMAALITRARGLRRFEWSSAIGLLLLVGCVVAVERSAPADVWRFTWQNALSRTSFLVAEVVLIGLVAHKISACLPKIAAEAQGSIRLETASESESLLTQTSNATKTQGVYITGALLLAVFYFDLLTHVPGQNPTVRPALYAAGVAQTQFGDVEVPTLGRSRAMVSPAARERLKQSWLADPSKNLTRNRLAGWSDVNLLDRIPEVDGFFSLVPRESSRVTELLYSHLAGESSPLLDFMGVTEVSKADDVCGWTNRSTALPLISIGQEPRFMNCQANYEALSSPNLDLRRTVMLPAENQGTTTAQADFEATTRDIDFQNEKISFETESTKRTVVVVAQTYYPLWRAYVDDHRVDLLRANYAFQALEVPAGRHHITLKYQDQGFISGAVLSIIGLAVWIFLYRSSARSERAHPEKLVSAETLDYV